MRKLPLTTRSTVLHYKTTLQRVFNLKVKVAYSDASVFKSLIEMLSKMLDEIVLTFREDGIRIRAMDPANIALVDVYYPKEAFTEYELEEESECGVNLAVVSRLLKRVKRGERLEIKVEDESVELSVTGIVKRSYVVKNFEVVKPEIPEAILTFKSKVTLLADPLKQALKDLEIIGDQVVLELNSKEKMLLVYSPSETRYVMKITSSSGAVIDIISEEDSKSTYSVDYMLNVISLTNVADTVTLEFSSEMPLRLQFTLIGEGRVEYLLAPSA